MAENTQLAAFLEDGRAGAAPPQEAPQTAPEPATATPAPKAPEPASTPTAAPKAAEEDDSGPPPAPLEGEDVVAFRAFQDERKKRQDWKEKAVRNEERAASLERQLEEAKRAAQEVQQPPPQPVYQPDPAVDPQGYHARVQGAMLNERLNISELLARKDHGAEAIDAAIAEFKQYAQQDPAAYQKLYAQAHPYDWLHTQVQALKLQREIAGDPAGYRARIEAEARAKWEQEQGQRVPQGHGAPPMQPSLATARSVAGRTAAPWTGEPSLDDVVASIQNRKKRA